MSDWLRRLEHGAEKFLDKVEDAAEDAIHSVVNVGKTVEKKLDRSNDLLEPSDGFVAFDPASGAVLGGRPPGVVSRNTIPGKPHGLPEILSPGDSNERVRFRLPGADMQRVTGRGGGAEVPLAALGTAVNGLDRKRGGLVAISAESEGISAQPRVLALPKDYDGPIFVSDIDDTLRATDNADLALGKDQPPIPGAKEILDGVAARGVPIVYLSAAPTQIRSTNDRFLGANMPRGVLLDNKSFGLKNIVANESESSRLQAEYKARVLRELKAAYPNAQIFGLGDDKWGDAVAYTQTGAKTYIHDVRPGDTHIPQGFSGVMSKDYDAAFRGKIHADLDAAIAASKSFKP